MMKAAMIKYPRSFFLSGATSEQKHIRKMIGNKCAKYAQIVL